MLNRQFLSFIAASGIAAVANFGSRIAFGLVMPYVPSIVLAYCLGMLTAFVLNRAFVFGGSRNRLHHQALWFIAINLIALAQTVLVSLLLGRWLFPIIGWHTHADTIAHGVGVLVPALSSYLGHKYFTFRS